jgi:hypothetical protein
MFGQGTYYPGPVNPAGTINYSTTTIGSSNDLQFLQNKLQSLYGTSLQTPPTAAQYSGAVTACVTDILNGVETGTGITLTTFSNEAVAWNASAVVATSGAIAQAVIQVDYTNNSNAAQAITDLTTVSTALSVSQPSLAYTVIQGIANQANQGTAAVAIAPGLPQIVTAALNQIPTDLAQIASLISNGDAAIVSANLNAMQKHTVFTDYVTALIGSTAASNNPLVIKVLAQQLTSTNVPTTVSTLQNTLSTAVAALPVQSNFTLAALADGALASNGSAAGGPANVGSAITGAAGFTGNATFVNQVVSGWSQGDTRAHLDTYLSANPGFADAIVSGATARGAFASNLILQDALSLGVLGTVGDPNPSNIVEAAMLANGQSATATIVGAINTTTHQPYGVGVTFGQVALGAASGAPIGSIGTVVGLLVLNSSASASTYDSATVNSITQNGIDGAFGANNSGAFADIVYKVEVQARNTSGISGPLVTAAISQIQSHNGLTYLAAIAAQAAGGGVGTNRAAIQAAADAALTGSFKAAADQAMALVQRLYSSSATHFVDVLSAINTAANTTPNGDAVRADLYAAMMQDPNDYDGNLAAALKETIGNPNGLTSQGNPITDAILLQDANNGIRGINSGVSANLQIVDTVVTHIQNEALGVGAAGVGDIFGYISHTIVTAPTLAKSVAIAATVTDPDHAHFIAKAVAYQAPTTVYNSIPAIFNYAQITNANPLIVTNGSSFSGNVSAGKTFPGTIGAIMDQPAAAAAITAGVTTGIVEASQSGAGSFNVQTALSQAVAAAVSASITQNGTQLQGQTNPFNASGDTGKLFQQSNGTAWNGASPSYTTAAQARTVGAAGAITGFVAEVTQSGDSTISAVTQAVLTAAVGGAARPYGLQMAQAAAQAFAWVSGMSATPDTTNLVAGNPVFDIANAIFTGIGSGYATLAQLENAVAFGIHQAEIGAIGAGALGLNATNLNAGNGTLVISAQGNANGSFYVHRSGTGTPVTDIFNL